MVLKKFDLHFNLSNYFQEKMTIDNNKDNQFIGILKSYGSNSYDNGLYRFHSLDTYSMWNDIVIKSFPEYKNQFNCFGFDWSGRQYAISNNDDNLLFMFDCAAFEVFELKTNIINFHNEILVENKFDTLLEDEFNDWYSKNDKLLKINECVGFKVPLFLNGKENLDNLELFDMQFYWEINQVLYFGE